MPLICVSSPKGGVGKTAFAANLCYSFTRLGVKSVAIDFDVQNSLRLHFGIGLADSRGYVATSSSTPDWSQLALTTDGSSFVLPYGEVNLEQKHWFEERLAQDEGFLSRGLQSLLSHPDLIVVADVPTGPSIYFHAVSALAEMRVIPFLSDTASLSLLPLVERQYLINEVKNTRKVDDYFVLNQVNNRYGISNHVQDFFNDRLGDKLLGVVHQDESVREALASQKSIHQFNASSVAAYDIELISKQILDMLNIKVGNGYTHKSHTADYL